MSKSENPTTEFRADDRAAPDARRRGRFKAGWDDAAIRDRTYSADALALLTWQNLGYRWGKALGPMPAEAIYRVYELQADQFGRNGDPLSDLPSAEDTQRLFPDEVPAGTKYREGAVRRVLVNAYERDRQARDACLAHYGPGCSVCGMRFDLIYGELGRDFIHVHHRRPIASIGEEYQVRPIDDLIPVCPNCHAMLHRGDGMDVDALRRLVEKHRGR